MGAIKNAIKAIEHGVEKAVKSIGQIASGLATLDLKKAAAGVKGLADAGADIARGAVSLTPAALAANTLMHGALDKILQKAQKAATSVADKIVDSVEDGLSNIKNGVVATAKGIAKGDIKQVLNGLKDVTVGCLETASNFGPGGIAKNIARMAVDTVVDAAVAKVTKEATKLLDPNGTSVLGGIAAQALGAAAGGALCGRGHSLGSFTKNSASNAAHEASQTARQGVNDHLNSKLDQLLRPVSLAELRDGGPDALSEALHKAVSQGVDNALRIAMESAIKQAVGALPPQHANALAGLRQGQVEYGKDIERKLHDTIETAVREAAATAIGNIVKDAMHRAAQPPQDLAGELASAMHHKVNDSVNHATRQVIEAVVGAVIEAAINAESHTRSAHQQQALPGVGA